MIGRVATLFAGGDSSKAAVMVNAFSAISSGFAIMFLFWTITHLVRRVFVNGRELEAKHVPAIIGSGIIGALTYTFSDTFWFSAVEGEVYAMSSLITGFVFWGMLKWEEEADKAIFRKMDNPDSLCNGSRIRCSQAEPAGDTGTCFCILF